MPIILEPVSCIERVPLVEHLGKTFSQAIKHMGSWSPDRSAEPGRGGRKTNRHASESRQNPKWNRYSVMSLCTYVFSYVWSDINIQISQVLTADRRRSVQSARTSMTGSRQSAARLPKAATATAGSTRRHHLVKSVSFVSRQLSTATRQHTAITPRYRPTERTPQ